MSIETDRRYLGGLMCRDFNLTFRATIFGWEEDLTGACFDGMLVEPAGRNTSGQPKIKWS